MRESDDVVYEQSQTGLASGREIYIDRCMMLSETTLLLRKKPVYAIQLYEEMYFRLNSRIDIYIIDINMILRCESEGLAPNAIETSPMTYIHHGMLASGGFGGILGQPSPFCIA